MQEIKITVKPDGEVVFGVTGVNGADCKKLTKELEKAMGKEETCKKTNDYYKQNNTLGNQQNIGGGNGW